MNADPDYADHLAEARRLNAEADDALQPQSLRGEIRSLINAPKGSDAAKARSTLGWMLILFGLFGIPLLFWLLFWLGATVMAMF